MSAFVQLLRWDFAMQVRHGFWVAAAFALLPWVGVLLSISADQATFILPALIFVDVSIAGTLFMAGVYFFERREGSIFALAVTPMKTWHWLTSKLVTLTAMGLAMCIVLVAVKKGIHAPWGPVLLACLCVNASFILFGFALAASAERFTTFFVRWVPFFALMEVPCLSFAGISHPAFWVLPTQPTVVLLRGAFDGIATTPLLIALGAQLAWIALAYWLCLRAFDRNVADRGAGSP